MPAFDTSTSLCIICGQVNPIGMRLVFHEVEHGVAAGIRVSTEWQGYEAIVHGGIVAGMLDDAMWHAIYQETSRFTVTAELCVRYKRPVTVGQLIWLSGRVDRMNARLIRAEAEIRQDDAMGSILATAEGRFMPAPEGMIIGSRHDAQ